MDSPNDHELLLSTFTLDFRTLAVIVVCGLVALLWKVAKAAQVDHDPREPAVVSHSIPYVGHLLGVFKHGLRYYQVVL